MFMEKILSIIDLTNRYKTTHNIFKKIYYKIKIRLKRKPIIKYILSAPLIKIITDFATTFCNITDVQDPDVLLIIPNEDYTTYTMQLKNQDTTYISRIDINNIIEGIDLTVIPNNRYSSQYRGVIPFDKSKNNNNNEFIEGFNHYSRIIIASVVFLFVEIMLDDKLWEE